MLQTSEVGCPSIVSSEAITMMPSGTTPLGLRRDLGRHERILLIPPAANAKDAASIAEANATHPMIMLGSPKAAAVNEELAANSMACHRSSGLGLLTLVGGLLPQDGLSSARRRSDALMIQKAPQLPAPARVFQLAQRLRLDLADAFARDRELLADLLRSEVNTPTNSDAGGKPRSPGLRTPLAARPGEGSRWRYDGSEFRPAPPKFRLVIGLCQIS